MSDLAGKFRLSDTLSVIGELIAADDPAFSLEERFPPLGGFVTADGVELHYVERGSGRPVVFLHGAGGMLEEFISSPLAELLAERYRTIVFDRPGYGHSKRPHAGLAGPRAQASVVHSALGALGIERPILIGHSWGGAMALAYAAEFPQDLSALVILAGWAFPARQAAILLFSLPAAPFLGGMVHRVVWPTLARSLAAEAVQRIFTPNLIPPAFSASFPLELALRPSQLLADAEDLRALNPCVARMQQRYPSIRIPVELVTGNADVVVDPVRHAIPLAAMLPDARLTVLPSVGHMVHHVSPLEVRSAVDRAARRSE
jgi:pimeloyl-ACP methyl ester carboxylesterase